MYSKKQVDDMLIKYHVQPVGKGYIDCICPMENVITFIDVMSKMHIAITELSWWCFVSKDHKPCGMGGPASDYGMGWFSEIEMGSTLSFSSNELVKNFLTYEWPKSKEYKSCFVPGLWLKVPDDWDSSSLHKNKK